MNTRTLGPRNTWCIYNTSACLIMNLTLQVTTLRNTWSSSSVLFHSSCYRRSATPLQPSSVLLLASFYSRLFAWTPGGTSCSLSCIKWDWRSCWNSRGSRLGCTATRSSLDSSRTLARRRRGVAERGRGPSIWKIEWPRHLKCEIIVFHWRLKIEDLEDKYSCT